MPTEKTILILNNDRNLRETLALIFRRAGYCVFSAIDVEHAQIYTRDLTCDMAILDLSAGDAEEIRVISDFRASHPNLPILLLTGNPPVDLDQFTKEHQITGYLQKPVDPAKMLAWVDEEFKKK
jgi:two-component system, NtrC family, response regulator HydG